MIKIGDTVEVYMKSRKEPLVGIVKYKKYTTCWVNAKYESGYRVKLVKSIYDLKPVKKSDMLYSGGKNGKPRN